jgi:hypothetical protein
MNRHTKNGQIVAAILTSSWRRAPLPLTVSAANFETAVPLVLETGAAGLAYHRLCHDSPLTAHHSPLTTHHSLFQELRQAYRLHTLQSAIQHHHLADLLVRLRTAGIEPLIVKGWSVARLYTEPGLRPAGDIDLCVRPEDMSAACAVLKAASGRCGSVDLHAGVADLDRPVAEVYARSRLVALGGVGVRILGAEDQLRHLCLHLMRHGGWRALWLCDVAAAVESLPADFDWDHCLSGDRRLTQWVQVTIGLARRLLGARVNPPDRAAIAVPSWLLDTLLESWGRGAESNDAVARPFAASLRNWRSVRDALRRRWPNPIRAAFKLGLGPFASWPVPTVQLLAFLMRAGQYALGRLPRSHQGSGPFDVHPEQVR